MGEDLISGRVTAFRKEQGFGTITLDDGRAVKFDASICKMTPAEGDAVRLRIAPAKWGGGFKAVMVEPASDVVPASPHRATLYEKIAMLQGAHLVSGLSEQVLDALVAELFGGRLEDAKLLDILDGYYAKDPARAIADGYLRHDGRVGPEASDVLAELAEHVPGARLPRQLEWTRRQTTERGHAEEIATLHVELPGGGRGAVDVDSLDDIVRLANEALAAAGDPRRFHALATGGDWHAYLALPPDRAARLARVLALQPGARA